MLMRLLLSSCCRTRRKAGPGSCANHTCDSRELRSTWRVSTLPSDMPTDRFCWCQHNSSRTSSLTIANEGRSALTIET